MNTDMLNGYPVIASANLSARRGCFPARIVIVDRSEPSGSMGKDPFVVALHRDGDSHWVDGAYYETWIEAWEDFKDRVQSDRPRVVAR